MNSLLDLDQKSEEKNQSLYENEFKQNENAAYTKILFNKKLSDKMGMIVLTMLFSLVVNFKFLFSRALFLDT